MMPIPPINSLTAWKPHKGPQEIALRKVAFELLYGGSRGPGKTDAGIVWMQKPVDNPAYRGLVIRKNAEDLKDWHDRARNMYWAHKAEIIGHPAEIRFPSGAKIRTGHLKDDNAYEKYQGHEYQRILIEELTQIPTEERYLKLISSCRSTVDGIDARVFCTTNPGGPGHGWVKRRFIDVAEPFEKYTDPITGRTRIFVPGKVTDNPTLMSKDPNYVHFLDGLPEPLRSAWRDGNWNVFAGQYFNFLREHHVYNPHEVKLLKTWPRFRSIDWGYASPMACYWHAIGPDRHIYTYREWYKTRKLDVEAAREIRGITENAGETIEYTVGDPQSFPMQIAHYSKNFGKTVPMKRSEVWAEEGVPLLMGDSSRIPGWSRMREYLRIDQDTKESHWHISEDCPNLIEELMTVVHDKRNLEDVSSDSVDHGCESCVIAGTCILTEHGEKPIEEIKVGDLVHTRKGLRKVLVSKATGEKETVGLSLIDGRFLIASTDHPVLCGETWKPISRLEKGEKVWITQISTAKRGRYGAKQMAIFQKNTTFTILTETQPTTTSPTLNSLNEASIYQNMERSLITEHPNLWRTSQGLDRWQRLQGKIQKYWKKSVNAIKSLGQKSHITIRNAVFAAVNIRQNVLQYPSFALVGVSNEAQRNLEGIRSSESAIFAERSTSAANSTSQKPVPIVAAIVAGVVKGAKQRVYNLQVDDCPEYFANGVLVHNCRLFIFSRPPLLESETDRPITHLEAAEKQSERERELVGKPIGM